MIDVVQSITNIPDPVLSSEVGDLAFAVDAESAHIEVAPLGDDPFFSAQLNPVLGKCYLYQADDILTDYMKAHSLSFASFSIKEKSGSAVSLKVLLSDRVFPGGFAKVKNFPLMASDVCVVPSYGSASLYFYATAPDNAVFSADISGYDEEGCLQTTYINLPGARVVDSAIAAVDVSPLSLIDYINQNLRLDFEFVSIGYMRVQCAAAGFYMHASVYVIDEPDLVEFKFLNCFGLRESVYLHAQVLPKLKKDSQDAVLGHTRVTYDIEHQQSFEVEASNIPESDWPKISQFIASYKVWDSYGREIVLTDASPEIGLRDELGSLKFNYSYSDNRIVAD